MMYAHFHMKYIHKFFSFFLFLVYTLYSIHSGSTGESIRDTNKFSSAPR